MSKIPVLGARSNKTTVATKPKSSTTKKYAALLGSAVSELTKSAQAYEEQEEHYQNIIMENTVNLCKNFVGCIDPFYTNLEKQFFSIGASVEKWTERIVSLEAKQILLTNYIQTIKEKCDSLETEKQTIERNNLELQNQIKQLQESNDIASQNQSNDKENEQLILEIEELKKKLDDQKTEYLQQIEKSNHTILDLTTQLENQKAQQSATNNELEYFKERVEGYEKLGSIDSISEAKKEIQKLKDQLEVLHKEIDDKNQQIEESMQETIGSQSQSLLMEQQVGDLEEEIADLRKELEMSKTKNEEIQGDFNDLSSQYTEIFTKYTELSKKYETVRKSSDEFSEKNSALELHIEHLNEQLRLAHTEIDSSDKDTQIADLQKKLAQSEKDADLVNALTLEVEQLRDTLKNKNVENDQLQTALQTMPVADNNNDLEHVTSQLNSANQMLLQYRNENDSLQAKLNSSELNLQAAKMRNNSLENQLDNLMEQLHNANNKLNEQKDRISNTELEQDMMRMSNAEFEKQISVSQAEIRRLNNELESNNRKLQKNEDNVKKMETMLSNLQLEKEQFKNERSALVNKLSKAEETINNLAKQNEDQIASYVSKVEEANLEIIRLKEFENRAKDAEESRNNQFKLLQDTLKEKAEIEDENRELKIQLQTVEVSNEVSEKIIELEVENQTLKDQLKASEAINATYKDLIQLNEEQTRQANQARENMSKQFRTMITPSTPVTHKSTSGTSPFKEVDIEPLALADENRQLHESITKISRNRQMEIKILQQNLENTRNMVHEKTAELTARNMRIAELENIIGQHEDLIESLQTKLKDTEKRLNAAKSELCKSEVENRDTLKMYSSAVRDATAASKELRSYKQELDRLINGITSASSSNDPRGALLSLMKQYGDFAPTISTQNAAPLEEAMRHFEERLKARMEAFLQKVIEMVLRNETKIRTLTNAIECISHPNRTSSQPQTPNKRERGVSLGDFGSPSFRRVSPARASPSFRKSRPPNNIFLEPEIRSLC